jgi:hypothetical protein
MKQSDANRTVTESGTHTDLRALIADIIMRDAFGMTTRATAWRQSDKISDMIIDMGIKGTLIQSIMASITPKGHKPCPCKDCQ